MFDTVVAKSIEPVRWLVIIGIAYTLATTIWSFFATPTASNIVAAPTAQPTQATKPRANVNWILSKHLFGQAGAKPAVEDSGPAVQTRLPLELRSVFVADDPQESAAIVAQRGKPAQLYSIDDTLPGNATLVEVHSDRIILRRAGVRETLLFPEWKSSFSQDPVEDANATAQRYRPSTARRQDDDYPADEELDDDPLAAADELRERLAADAQGTLNELGVEAADGGGYRLGNVANSPYLRQTGLQTGDVILSVNGRPVGDIEQDQMEIENILAQGTARIEIKRGERRFYITASLPK